ncbi:DUF5313 family protein [Saccharopolyspora mangrovi]|uniref:DUF5313 family protein n=1 Tax=Saccharopolyspora mangrovi TaxID=3082379 RepID=A0ABU6AEI0_9PSEU|nr:DUF5313 family protein [Saccharopolyspora sp. S2-29]MEB3369953.1 DUF5313 family protein [Saccharopolyspora sp. S2-29]
MIRPGPLRWVFHQYGGRLPERYRDWVLHDATCRTWVLRVLVRGLLQIAPIGVVLSLVPCGGSIRLRAEPPGDLWIHLRL